MATTHYVCTGGCLMVRYAPGYCNTPGCFRHRNPLSECTCEDDTHGDLLHLNDIVYREQQQSLTATPKGKKSPVKRSKKNKKSD